MIFWIAMPALLLISFLLALRSLKKELRKPKEIKLAKKELMKEKVLFIKD